MLDAAEGSKWQILTAPGQQQIQCVLSGRKAGSRRGMLVLLCVSDLG